MLDYKSIIIKRYALGLSYKELAEEFSASKSGINDFIRAFERCEKLSYPLPEGITNYAIYELVYGHEPGTNKRNAGYEQPDFAAIFRQMNERKNMTLVYLWSRYQKDCTAREVKPYQYRQFCELYARWCNENYETLHIQAVIAQKMEVDFAGKTFELIDKLTGEITTIVVFVAVLPYSQYIYAEGMISTCEPQSVMIAASATTVNIYSMKGELIVSWRRASRRGEWLTDPAHLPESYKQMSEWNASTR